MIKKSILKILILLIIIGLNWTGFLAVGKTLAYFFDNENSNANTYQASTLDFSLTSSNLNKFIGLTEKLFLGSVLTNSGSLAFQYTVASEKISGSDDFCNALELEAELNWVEKHNDTLMSFDVLASTTLGSWSFEIKLPVTATNIFHGETCEVDLVFKGWQTDVATYEDGGFSDEERIHLKFTSRMIVLNEFLPNPSGLVPDYGFDFGEDGDSKPQGEWVELYNNSDVNHDLAGWYIWDASGDNLNKISITNLNTQTATTIILGNSWLVVYMNKEVFDNTGDTVKLFDSADALIDSYTYIADNDYCEIEPTPGDENATNTTGSCGGVPPNKSYARIPDGIGYWVDPIPTPGGPNILELEIINQEEAIEEEPPVNEEEPSINEEPPVEEEEPPTEEEPLVEKEPVVDEEPATEEELIGEETPPAEEQITNEETTETSGEITEDVVDEGVEEEPIVEEPPITEEGPVVEEEPAEEEVTTEENQEEGGIIEEINEIIDEVIDAIVDEIMPAEETGDELVSEPEVPAVPVIEDALIIEEAPADETPAVEEQPAMVPDDGSSPSPQDGMGEGSGDGGGDTSGSSDSSSPTEGAGESSGDSGDTGDSVSE